MSKSINMNPGKIDWTKEDLVLLTNSGVEHYPGVEKSKLSKNYVKIYQQWAPYGYSINNYNNVYLSAKIYRAPGHFYRVGDFKEALNSGEVMKMYPYNGSYYRGNDNEEKIFDNDLELRIYHDRSVVLLHQVIIDNKPIYYVVNNPDVVFPLNIVWGGAHTERNKKDPTIHIVQTDEEVYKLARPMSQKLAKAIWNRYLFNFASDLSGRFITYLNVYETGYFTKETQETVEKFFSYNSDGFNFLRREHARNMGETNDIGIKSIKSMLTWCYTRSTASTQAQTKEDKANILLTCVQDEWDHPDEHVDEVIWARQNDDIIVIIPNLNRGGYGWGYGSGCKKLFAYNVKTKKRFYGEYSGGHWTFPIPGLSYIITAMYIGKRSSAGETIFPKTIIKGNLTARELFDQTNIAWILDNTTDECKILNSDDNSDGNYYYANKEEEAPINVKDYLSDKRIGTIALSILVTTGIPMLEQLLKSKLFNMYFVAIKDLEQRGSGSTEVFYDVDKKRAYSNDHGSSFSYSSKGKNLKKMFGMSLNMLRILDSKMCFIDQDQNSRRYGNKWTRVVPRLIGVEKAIGVDFTTLDLETFNRCIEIAADYSLKHSCGGSIWSEVNTLIADSFKTPNPKQVLNLIDAYKDDLNIYRDYLRMRAQLERIQQIKSDVLGIFSDKVYPMRPGASKRFIPFLNGMPDRFGWWSSTRTLTPENFLNHYRTEFRFAEERGDFHQIYDETKNPKEFLGIAVSLTPMENLRYLHDDASYWVSFYQDAEKENLFADAVKRVIPLEWEDKTSGLEIRAPKSVADLKKEGHILSHCVASYVDPIINGTENIMFLRRTDMPGDPFYTVEVLNDGQIRQVHCYRNGDLTETGQKHAYQDSGYEVYNKTFDIVKFLTKWAGAHKGKINASTIKSAYGALCALR